MQIGDSIQRSVALRHEGAYGDAEQLINALIAEHPHDFALWDEYARIANAKRAQPEAIERWLQARTLTRSSETQRRIDKQIAAAYLAAGQLAEARALLGNLLHDNIPDMRVRELIGILCYKEKRAATNRWEFYWQSRAGCVYVHVCAVMMQLIGRTARSVADVGSNRTPMLDYLPNVARRYSVDPYNPYVAPGIVSIKDDFLQWNPGHPIDLGTCFQVMEHVPETETFARRLMELCEVVLVSVPFKERPGQNPGHVHHSIDLETIASWFGRQPNFHYVAVELTGEQRIIGMFDRLSEEAYPKFHAGSPAALKYMFRWSLEGSGFGAAS